VSLVERPALAATAEMGILSSTTGHHGNVDSNI
jgi:hypothetical protein